MPGFPFHHCVDVLKAIAFTVVNDATAGDVSSSSSSSDSEEEETDAAAAPKAPEWLHMAVYEYCPNGDLFNYLKKHPQVSKDVNFIKNLFVGLLSAMTVLTEAGYVHNDIKPENVLLDDELKPKLADFGSP